MTYDIGLQLAGVPLSTAIPFAVAIGILLSIVGSWLVNSVFTPFELEPNNFIGGAKFGFLGEVYAVTLGLAMIGAFDHFTTAQTNTQREAATLSSLSWAADTYDQPGQEADRAAMRRAVQEYARAVVEKEWRVMSYGLADPDVSNRLADMNDVFMRVEPMTEAQASLQQNTIEWVNQINEYRALRLTTVSRSLIALVWAVLVSGTLMAIVFPWFFGTVNVVSQTVMSALLTSFLMLHLLMVLQLSYPFIGDASISPTAFLNVMR
ncbi:MULTISPECIES: DUF4239 domain-containing protein [Thalassobaculum]|uniref:DUF4239 domain-containing protein n=1 Tax=Thalassobaculum litoreum DSM 18839 TaxID=1123362 RepID=A0A8G2BG99_9PROT|nr:MULTISPECIES: DUF4239 domain-containing protein [Thalassobaculum]SDF44566.1 Protein of unknown function [Thalassobaculum litoreum DSM 18839]